jgi:hypothetical protein
LARIRWVVSARFVILNSGELPVVFVKVFIDGKSRDQAAKKKGEQSGETTKLIPNDSGGEPSQQRAHRSKRPELRGKRPVNARNLAAMSAAVPPSWFSEISPPRQSNWFSAVWAVPHIQTGFRLSLW